jgi:hypothetical protein
MELLLLGRAAQCSRRAFAPGDHLRDIIEISSPDFALMFRGGVAIRFGRKLGFL